jgi:hypothetical protein
MKPLVASVVLAIASVAWAATPQPPRTVKVCGKDVEAGETFEATEMFKVSQIRLCAGRLAENAELCTIMTGMLTSSAPTREIAVEIEVTLYNVAPYGGRIWTVGTFKATVQRPERNKPVKFIAIGKAACKTVENMKPIFDSRPLTNTYSVGVKMVPAEEQL